LSQSQVPGNLLEEVVELSNPILSLLKQGVESFLGLKAGLTNRTIDEGKKLADACAAFLTYKVWPAGSSGLPLHSLVESLRRVALYTTDIAETTLNATVERSIQ